MPLVSDAIAHVPEAPLIVQVPPPELAVTTIEVAPTDAAVIETCPVAAVTVGTPGCSGAPETVVTPVNGYGSGGACQPEVPAA